MNWEAIGAIGEVAGAIAVVVTLVYLSIQVRQNSLYQEKASQIAEADVNFSMLESFSRQRQMTLERSDLIRRMDNGERLEDGELMELITLSQETIFTYGHNYLAAKAMKSQDMQAGMVEGMYLALQNRPALKRYWRKQQGFLSNYFFAEFYGKVNQKLAQTDSEVGTR